MPAISTLAELNKRDREFWAVETTQMVEIMGDDAVRETALAEEQARVPLKSRMTLESALSEAAKAKQRFSGARNRADRTIS